MITPADAELDVGGSTSYVTVDVFGRNDSPKRASALRPSPPSGWIGTTPYPPRMFASNRWNVGVLAFTESDGPVTADSGL